LRIHGIADASVVPDLIGGNTDAVRMMIGRKLGVQLNAATQGAQVMSVTVLAHGVTAGARFSLVRGSDCGMAYGGIVCIYKIIRTSGLESIVTT
jgi:hypothetical protein